MATDVLESESTLGVLIILFLVIVSTAFVLSQRQQRPAGNGGGAFAQNGAPRATDMQSLGQHVVSTAHLTDKQRRLHRALPNRNGARTITVCVDALLQYKTDPTRLAWVNDETANALRDLCSIADVYLLCRLEQDDKNAIERIRDFLVASASAEHPIKPHKILFCTTSIGKVAFVRQLEPQVHVEAEAQVARDLEKHVPRIIHITSSGLNTLQPPGVHHISESLSGYCDLVSAI